MNTTLDQIDQATLNGPAMVPPPGVIPNFVDPPSLRHAATTMLALYLVLSMIVVLMRMYTKIFILRQMASEDCKP